MSDKPKGTTDPSFDVRVLLRSDREQVFEVFKTQPTILKHNKDDRYLEWFAAFTRMHLKASLDESMGGPARLVGAFRDGELLSYVGQKEWDTFPFWTVNSLYSKRGKFNTLDLRANGMGRCMDLAAAIAEERERYTFYWVTDADRWNSRERIWSHFTQTFKRYIILPERVIKPGMRPPWSYEFQMIGGRPWARPIAIKSAHLKKGYRHEYLVEKGFVDEPFIDLQGNGF